MSKKKFEDYESLMIGYNYYQSYHDNNYEIHSIIRREKKNVPAKTGFKHCETTWKDNEMIDLIKLKYIPVAKGLGQEFLGWIPRVPVLLSAQTGLGKNTYIEIFLIPYCIAHGLKILIVVNRIALARQEKYRVCKLQGIELPKDYTNRELDSEETYGCVTITTYQKLATKLDYFNIVDESNHNYIDNDYKFCCMDEIHELANTYTWYSEKLLKAMRKKFSNCIRIYMTSTPNDVADEIIKAEKELPMIERNIRLSNPALTSLYKPKIICYSFKRDYSFIITKYFWNYTEIVSKILGDKSGKKWLIFVKSKNEGHIIAEMLGEDVAVYIDATSKDEDGINHDTYEKIINDQKFHKRCLVCTTVIDVGINLIDDSLVNIVVMTREETTLVQTIGRKRIKSGEKINLYIQNRTVQQLQGSIFRTKNKLEAYDLFCDNELAFRNQYLTGNLQGYSDICNLIHFNNKNEIEWNGIAINKLIKDKKLLEKIKAKIVEGDPDAWIKEQLSYLELEKTFNVSNYLDNKQKEDYINDFMNFLDTLVDKSLDKEQQEKLSWDFKNSCVKAYGKRKGKDGKSIDRNDRGYGIDVIKSVLEELKLPYVLSSLDGFWEFKKNKIIGEN